VRFIGPCVQLQHRVLPVARRDVWIGTACDGIAPLIAHLDTITARAVLAAVQATADISPDVDQTTDTRTAGERRADAPATLVLGSGSPVRVTAEVQVTIPVDQLTGRGTGLDLHGLSCLLADPAIACTLRPVLTATSPDGTSGHVLDVGRRSCALPAALRRLVVARDRTCRFPGCGRSASRAQIDHAQPDGSCTWTSPLGRTCDHDPPPY
jgi:hypothetical protein